MKLIIVIVLINLIGLAVFKLSEIPYADTTPKPDKDIKVTCYSGERVIYMGFTKKIKTNKYAEGFRFTEFPSGNYIRVSGDCVVVTKLN